mmetsp:Transcript_57073/g.101941  ORF Transcript_57073/g.101941 Transcript_57073/m.101941 type:complete len:226 (+) Transcript_57073:1059-1736(+)
MLMAAPSTSAPSPQLQSKTRESRACPERRAVSWRKALRNVMGRKTWLRRKGLERSPSDSSSFSHSRRAMARCTTYRNQIWMFSGPSQALSQAMGTSPAIRRVARTWKSCVRRAVPAQIFCSCVMTLLTIVMSLYAMSPSIHTKALSGDKSFLGMTLGSKMLLCSPVRSFHSWNKGFSFTDQTSRLKPPVPTDETSLIRHRMSIIFRAAVFCTIRSALGGRLKSSG